MDDPISVGNTTGWLVLNFYSSECDGPSDVVIRS